MLSKIKIWHFILFVLTLIIVLRITAIIDIAILIASFIRFLFYKPGQAINFIDWVLFDYFVSILLLFITPVVVVLLKNKIKILAISINTVGALIIILIIGSVLAPVIPVSSPKFQYDISAAKLLPPLSSMEILELKPIQDRVVDPLINFIRAKSGIRPEVVDKNYFVADKIEIGDEIIIYNKGQKKIIQFDYLVEKRLTVENYSTLFMLGTDEYGRDLFSRIIYGARLSLFIGFGSILVSLTIGLGLGFISGFFGGLIDTVLNRLSEMFMAFPMIFLVILIIALMGSSLPVIVFILGFSGWMSLYKIIRSEVISIKEKDFIVTAKLLGRSKSHILFNEMIPVMISPIVVNLVLQYSNVIVAESALSYLGLGLGNQYASWGSMIAAGQYYLSQAWWMSFFPCLFLFITLLTLNNLGNKFEKILDPRLQR